MYSVDTIKLRLKLTPEICTQIESFSMSNYYAVDSDGTFLYHFSRGTVMGSYDNSINIKIWDKQYLILEFSLTKFFLGHNCFNRSGNLLLDLIKFKFFLESLLKVDLGSVQYWEILKIDVSINYDLGSQSNVKKYVNSLRAVSYPRRKVRTYEDEGIHIAGSTSTIKFYNKQLEFKKHDYPKISLYNKEKAFELMSSIDNILRVEVSIKTKKLIDFKINTVNDFVSRDLLYGVVFDFYKSEVTKVLKNNVSVLKVFTKTEEVERILYLNCSSNLAASVLSTWFQVGICGYNSYRNKIKFNDSSLRKFQRHIKIMKNLNISLHESDVMLKPIENENFCLYDFDLFDPQLLYRQS